MIMQDKRKGSHQQALSSMDYADTLRDSTCVDI